MNYVFTGICVFSNILEVLLEDSHSKDCNYVAMGPARYGNLHIIGSTAAFCTLTSCPKDPKYLYGTM